jgi:hypothetical protein
MEGERSNEGVWMEAADAVRERRARRGERFRRHAGAIARLFFIQSSRNDRTLDGLGFFAALAPSIRRWARTAAEARETARRHLGYFNAGLYLSSTVAGVVRNMEERRARGEDVPSERIDRVKAALSSVLAARANYFFDMLLIPLGLTIASICAIYSSYVGIVIFLALYNFYHFQSRIGGYFAGAELGEGVDGAFVGRLFREERLIGGCAAFASGAFTALLFARARSAGGAAFVIWSAVALAASALGGKRLPVLWRIAALFLATALFLVLVPSAARMLG